MEPVKLFLALCTLALLLCAGCANQGQPKTADTQVPTATVTTVKIPSTQALTTTEPPLTTPTAISAASPVPTVSETRYPNALKLKSAFTFGNGTSWTSDAAVNRIWINDTYRWYNPEEHQYETRVAPAGKKFLFIFLTMVNRGSERAPLPTQGNIYVICDNDLISPYSLHPLPMENPDSTPRIARIAEIEYSHKVYSSEQVEDYGYSHGQKLSYINPGESNAVEGYIIYEVPASMTPEKSFVTILLPDKSEAVWVLG
jgi:hypothetical protein